MTLGGGGGRGGGGDERDRGGVGKGGKGNSGTGGGGSYAAPGLQVNQFPRYQSTHISLGSPSFSRARARPQIKKFKQTNSTTQTLIAELIGILFD
jgi:hypothetical protein